MQRTVDLAKVEAALKRAAEKGIGGSPEARAGRFHAAPSQTRIVKPIQPPLAPSDE